MVFVKRTRGVGVKKKGGNIVDFYARDKKMEGHASIARGAPTCWYKLITI